MNLMRFLFYFLTDVHDLHEGCILFAILCLMRAELWISLETES